MAEKKNGMKVFAHNVSICNGCYCYQIDCRNDLKEGKYALEIKAARFTTKAIKDIQH